MSPSGEMIRSRNKRSPAEISSIMRRVRSSDTTPELLLRKALWARGVRYRISPAKLHGKPDIVVPANRLAIFVDGDLWHGGQWRRRGLVSLDQQFRNIGSKAYWLRKIRRNMQRDCEVTAKLIAEGWRVIRLWEKDITKNLEHCVELTMSVIENGVKPTSNSLFPQKTFLEFFAGIGLMRLGLERGGWSLAFANDIDEQKFEMYSEHFHSASEHFVLNDIHELKAEDVPSATLATASFPCNDLSLAGARAGLKGLQSSAFWGLIRILEEMKERRPL
jgi:DNA mismatch endonuclease Vsr